MLLGAVRESHLLLHGTSHDAHREVGNLHPLCEVKVLPRMVCHGSAMLHITEITQQTHYPPLHRDTVDRVG